MLKSITTCDWFDASLVVTGQCGGAAATPTLEPGAIRIAPDGSGDYPDLKTAVDMRLQQARPLLSSLAPTAWPSHWTLTSPCAWWGRGWIELRSSQKRRAMWSGSAWLVAACLVLLLLLTRWYTWALERASFTSCPSISHQDGSLKPGTNLCIAVLSPCGNQLSISCCTSSVDEVPYTLLSE